VAVSRSPSGPFKEINSQPIDYLPFDPDYHDVNLIMDSEQMKPPSTQSEGETAPKGIFIPSIDPNIYFAEDGRIFLYYSRNAYRNWVWDTHGLNKYIEESNILGVELNRSWWDDPEAKTMPSIVDSQKDFYSKVSAQLPSNISSFNGTGEDIKEPKRKDGWKTLISYNRDPQEWENFHVNDYNKFNGTKKDRRWSEGSTLVSRSNIGSKGKGKGQNKSYLMTYSCNNYEAENYGIGFATSADPLGPFKKSTTNPILTQKPVENPPAFSVGHGSIVATKSTSSRRHSDKQQDAQLVTHQTPETSELFYVHHGRNSTTSDRSLYTTRMELEMEKDGALNLTMNLQTRDQRIAEGTSPYSMKLKSSSPSGRCLNLCSNKSNFEVEVFSSSGAQFDLSYPHHRLQARLEPQDLGLAKVKEGTGKVEVDLKESNNRKGGKVVVSYQRRSVDGSFNSIVQSEHKKAEVVRLEEKLCNC